MCVYIYIYIEQESGANPVELGCKQVRSVRVFIYIYIYINTHVHGITINTTPWMKARSRFPYRYIAMCKRARTVQDSPPSRVRSRASPTATREEGGKCSQTRP